MKNSQKGILLVVIVALIAAFVFIVVAMMRPEPQPKLQSQSQPNIEAVPDEKIVPEESSEDVDESITNTQADTVPDIVYINKGVVHTSTDGSGNDDYSDVHLYKVDLNTKKVELFKDRYVSDIDTLKTYAGLPPFIQNSTIFTDFSQRIPSRDKQEILVTVATRDKTVPGEGFGGSLIITNEKEFRCVVAEKRCYPSTILADADAAIGVLYKPYPRYESFTGVWLDWSVEKGLLYGFSHGEGGPHDPVLLYDIKHKKVISVYDTGQGHEIQSDINSTFDLVWVLDQNYYDEPYSRLKIISVNKGSVHELRDINLLSIITIPPSSTFQQPDVINNIHWSADEKRLLITTNTKLYSLDIYTGELALKANAVEARKIQKLIQSEDYARDKKVLFSPSGRYVYFIDFKDDPTQYSQGLRKVSTLKTIDLLNNYAVTDVVADDYLTIDYAW